jgi:hypothetical protein
MNLDNIMMHKLPIIDIQSNVSKVKRLSKANVRLFNEQTPNLTSKIPISNISKLFIYLFIKDFCYLINRRELNFTFLHFYTRFM